jgi:formate dehydrogenase subunit gamma
MDRREPVTALPRFDVNERVVHWATSLLMVELLVTGTILYIPSLSLKVGHRATVANIHVISGLCLLAPLILGLAGPWRGALVADLRRFDRWRSADFAWFRRSEARLDLATGKFNGGQKLAASLFGAGMVVMLATGAVMRWAPASYVNWATGATLVHDIVYIGLSLIVLVHVAKALSRPEQMKAMITGRISRRWAERHAPAWVDGSDVEA